MTDRRIVLASLVVSLATLALVVSLALRPGPEPSPLLVELPLDMQVVHRRLDAIAAALDQLRASGPASDPAVIEALDRIERALTFLDLDHDRLADTVGSLCGETPGCIP